MKLILPLLLIGICLRPASAQPAPRAILVDGDGPWRDGRWAFTVAEFSGLLRDAGYSVTTVSPVDLPSAVPARGRVFRRQHWAAPLGSESCPI